MLKITEPEYILMKKYIEDQCGIHLRENKEYLIESRLADMVAETGCKSFQEFHYLARTDSSGKLRDRIVDAITTNETSWFRDKSVWEYIREIAIPALLEKAMRFGKVSIWSAAVSTGQEIYSLLMLLDEAVRDRGMPFLLDKTELTASDVSESVLASASAARYDSIAINRGLPDDRREQYFIKQGQLWQFAPYLKNRVQFKKFNLRDSFSSFPQFDLILCRYVSIYFSDTFKRELFAKMASVLKPGGILLLGATESLREFSGEFDISYYKTAVVNTKL
ncbi:MAG: protein-glutamate O-methyltransferase CheR [Desulfobacteraceae bacterium]|nr:protein-glutamate O-methyltransferase CheR [Desulfobacteraceae bacterium]